MQGLDSNVKCSHLKGEREEGRRYIVARDEIPFFSTTPLPGDL
jgi:hypothetical protein